MNTASILSNLLAKKGQFGTIQWRKALKTYKGTTDKIEKSVTMSMRAGIDYDNMAIVKEKRVNGELPSENAGLPWGKWVAFPYLILHKEKHYVRVYPNGNGKIETEYFCNGAPTTLNEIRHLLLASEIPSGEHPDCITVTLENITHLS